MSTRFASLALLALLNFGPCSKTASTSPDPASSSTDPSTTADSTATAASAAEASSAKPAAGSKSSPHGSTGGTVARRRPAGAAAPQTPVVIDPGPAKVDVSSSHPDTVRTCAAKSDCDDGMMVCSPQHTCVCDSSRGFGRCGVGDVCHNELTDANNCGKCGVHCPSGQQCNGGHCGGFTCDSGETVCFDYCANLQGDHDDCGKCGHVCPGRLSCIKGHCEP